MKPFSSWNLNYIRENYIKCLSASRKYVKCAFGVLRVKWQILRKDIEVSSDKAVHIIKYICIQHNLIRIKDEDSDLDYYQKIIRQSHGNQTNELQERDNHGGARRGSTKTNKR
ncbi:Harbinger transposase-derived protein [Cinara cedri]|uniref:Harbinger transposase-derived protein n=1 Tax=Cinara cedri TaxID=506608 RepID=A0A5E4M2I4_9HEMI|nr:Harbinger transposase-derived protein [Cinara cedri]